MKNNDFTKKEIKDVFKIINNRKSDYGVSDKDEYQSPFEQKDVWIISDSSTSFINSNNQTYA